MVADLPLMVGPAIRNWFGGLAGSSLTLGKPLSALGAVMISCLGVALFQIRPHRKTLISLLAILAFAAAMYLLIRARIGDFDLIWAIAASSVGERYLYLPHVFLAWCILWALVNTGGWIRIPIGILVIVITTNIARSWSAPALPDLHWTSEVSPVGHAPIQVPINPVWSTGPWKATVCRLPCSIDR
jgi:hypothetical protein